MVVLSRQDAPMIFTLDHLFIKPYNDIAEADDDVELVWIGSSLKGLRAFPPTVRRAVGVSLGETPPISRCGGAGADR